MTSCFVFETICLVELYADGLLEAALNGGGVAGIEVPATALSAAERRLLRFLAAETRA